MEVVPARLTRFKCWWCSRDLGVRKLHHETPSVDMIRRCCNECYLSEDSNYRAVYPGGEGEESDEVRRVLESAEESGWSEEGWNAP